MNTLAAFALAWAIRHRLPSQWSVKVRDTAVDVNGGVRAGEAGWPKRENPELPIATAYLDGSFRALLSPSSVRAGEGYFDPVALADALAKALGEP